MRGRRTEPTEKKKKKKKRRGRRTNQQRRRRKKERETEKPTEKKKKKRKEEEEAVASWRHPCFVIVFFLFSFSVFFPYKWCFGPVSIYWPKQSDFAGTAGTRPVRPVFFPVRNKGYLYRCIDRNGIYWLYRPVRYGIDFFETKSVWSFCNLRKKS